MDATRVVHEHNLSSQSGNHALAQFLEHLNELHTASWQVILPELFQRSGLICIMNPMASAFFLKGSSITHSDCPESQVQPYAIRRLRPRCWCFVRVAMVGIWTGSEIERTTVSYKLRYAN